MDAKDILYGQNWAEQMWDAINTQNHGRTMEATIERFGMDTTWCPFSWADTQEGFLVWQERDGLFGGCITNILTR